MFDLLKAWAVLGPLAVGVAGALWSRRVQLQDRVYEQEQRSLERKLMNEDKEREFDRAKADAELKELRSAASEFLFYAGEFVDSGAELCKRTPGEGAVERHEDSRTNLNRSAHHFALISPKELADSAIDLHNCAAQFLSGRLNTNEEVGQKADEYAAAKSKFMSTAKKYIGLQIEA